jgi:predicted DCC family thiol-disulfide oxidoreductase YuxK
MSKQLILITAPFNCGYCETAKKALPKICKNHGFELIEMQDEKTGNPEEDLPVDLYPTIMIRVNEEIKFVNKGWGEKKVLNEIKKY